MIKSSLSYLLYFTTTSEISPPVNVICPDWRLPLTFFGRRYNSTAEMSYDGVGFFLNHSGTFARYTLKNIAWNQLFTDTEIFLPVRCRPYYIRKPANTVIFHCTGQALNNISTGERIYKICSSNFNCSSSGIHHFKYVFGRGNASDAHNRNFDGGRNLPYHTYCDRKRALPEKPPVLFASSGFPVLRFILIPSNVFIRLMPSAPAASQAFRKLCDISNVRGQFDNDRFLAIRLTAAVIFAAASGFWFRN